MKQEKILKFPKDFLWGVSTSAYQIEGGIHNDWSEWERSKLRITRLQRKLASGQESLELRNCQPEDFICGQACDSYNRYEEDLDLVKNLGCGAFRMGIEWARVEPAEGQFNMEEIEHYRRVLAAAKKRNLKIVLTLWHWTNPVWLVNKGGWANKKIIDYFIRYTELIVKELGEYVDFWIVLNEPMVPLTNGYLTGKFPPSKKFNIFCAVKMFKNLVRAYKKSYDIIHSFFPNTQVSVTQLVSCFLPARKWCLVETFFAMIAKYFSNYLFLDRIKEKFDFIGFDYYFYHRVVWYPPFKKNLNKKTTDMGWEIYPAGIYDVLKDLAKYNKPIYVMENGLADADDQERADFIINHLKYVHQAIRNGIDVRGYFYWSLLDNFEWAAGWAPKFGLYEVDRKTFKRTPRPSVEVYRDICKNNRIIID
jgi:beta-glucosidase